METYTGPAQLYNVQRQLLSLQLQLQLFSRWNLFFTSNSINRTLFDSDTFNKTVFHKKTLAAKHIDGCLNNTSNGKIVKLVPLDIYSSKIDRLRCLYKIECPPEFIQTAEGCFCVNNTNTKTWYDAEAVCQVFGSHVHLATIDTQQVLSVVLHQNETKKQNYCCCSLVTYLVTPDVQLI